jgi:hypothetical protein
VSELKAEAATREQAWTEEKELALKQHQDREGLMCWTAFNVWPVRMI